MTIKLTEFEVTLKESITWGDKEKIQQCYYKGLGVNGEGISGYDASVVSEARYKAVEVCVLQIKKGEDIIVFSNDWLSNLSVEDGEILLAEVDKVTTPKKNS